MNQEFFSVCELLVFLADPASWPHTGYCQLGLLAAPAATLALYCLQLPAETGFHLLLDSHGIRHTLAQHGEARSRVEAERGQLPITEADFRLLPSWLPAPATVRPGQPKPGKPPRLELETLLPSGLLMAVVKWRPRRQQLALVTLYKKRPAT